MGEFHTNRVLALIYFGENAIEKMYHKYKNIDYYNLYDINDKNKVRKKLKNKQEHEEAR
jgi:hypothetical protein